MKVYILKVHRFSVDPGILSYKTSIILPSVILYESPRSYLNHILSPPVRLNVCPSFLGLSRPIVYGDVYNDSKNMFQRFTPSRWSHFLQPG